MPETIIEIPKLFHGLWCFHDGDKRCPFAYREICPVWGASLGDDSYKGGYGDRVFCSLGLNNVNEISVIGNFSEPGPNCPGAGKRFKLVEVDDAEV